MTRVEVRILVRTDIDWRGMDRAAFESQSDRDRPLLFVKFAANKGLFDVWHKVFDVDYFDLRHELATIARRNHAAVSGAERVDGLARFDTWFADPGDEWILPVDDDDIFRADVAQRLAAVPPSAGVVVWPELAYFWPGDEPHGPYARGSGQEHNVGRPIVQRTRQRVLWTNNWAVRKSFLQRHFTGKQARQMLTDHRFATQQVAGVVGQGFPPEPAPWYDFDLSGAIIEQWDEPYSMTLKHPGSLFFLWNILQVPDPVGQLRMRRFGEPLELPPEAAWAGDEVRAMERLLRSAVHPAPSPATVATTGTGV